MAEALFRFVAGQVPFTAGQAYTSGEIIQLPDGRAGVIAGLGAIASGDPAVAQVAGITDVLCAAATVFAIGDPVYWDASANLAIVAPALGEDFFVGVAVKASSSSEATVLTDMNTGFAGAGASGNRCVWRSAAALLAHDDSTDHVIILAAENPNGLIVELFTGLVIEAPAGSSEDQLVMGLYDEDDNLLSEMTTTNTTPDAAGDIIQGTLTAGVSVTGTVLAIIPAGKAAYVKVSQATVGTAAGEVRVSALVSPLI